MNRYVKARSDRLHELVEAIAESVKPNEECAPSVLEAAVGAEGEADNTNDDKKMDEKQDWWTRTQRIRTVAEMPLEVALMDTRAAPVYQKIAERALHLRQLGLSDSAIAKKLNVTDKTVAKAITWLRALSPRDNRF